MRKMYPILAVKGWAEVGAVDGRRLVRRSELRILARLWRTVS
jgi:hypothetical protein